ncbi:hypothetical protein MIND_00967600 [Mycena indigotica]|uniref:F-box domain-containing protein n=1 Tax=Mycena indigotica TaxID=2126181 RepID=A0A8H6SFC7_9AGAR|nr:uncharacterized protein MIND_00967600 [Mycena indigotica]KAF7297342.1 hypothetical protein MIND_00967600 [Mycena indigotica]
MLEFTPHDILQHIALLTTTPVATPPSDLYALLATCRTLYRALNVSSNPHLYAAIFRHQYGPDLRNRTDSSLSAELHQRCDALGRCRRIDLGVHRLRQDMSTLFWMVLEHGSQCDALSQVGFSSFVVQLARNLLSDRKGDKNNIQLVVWLLCLALSRNDILSQIPEEVRDELVISLRPFVSTDASLYLTSLSPFSATDSQDKLCWLPPCSTPRSRPQAVNDEAGLLFYNKRVFLDLPPVSDAAVILIFALKEAVPLQAPYHLPATRALAISESRGGPTAEDYTTFQSTLTPLFSDIRQTEMLTQSRLATTRAWVVNTLPEPEAADQRALIGAGSIAGVWEGAMMISSCGLSEDSEPPDFLCRTPMQCEFVEQQHESPPDWDHRETQSGNCPNILMRPDVEACIALVGQTLPQHEEAWGSDGFTFAGRAHKNGEIVFTRRPKQPANQTSEAWLFIGRLCYGNALVGTFRSSAVDDACSVCGIFSLRKQTPSPNAAPE